MYDEKKIRELEQMVAKIRLNILRLVGVGRPGHLGGSNSAADIIAALYFSKIRYDAKNPKWELRDRVIFSKGHAALCQYGALAEMGVLSYEALDDIKNIDAILQGHPDMLRCPGIEANTGSLGQGLSISVGMAMGLRLDGTGNKVYCIMGDGELAEGQIWEAAMAAAKHKVDNIVGIVDRNMIQATGTVAEIFDSGDITAKFAAFGWETIEIDGHDIGQILAALDKADAVKGKPTAIIAKTIKGKGVSFAENTAAYHNGILTQEQYDDAFGQLTAAVGGA